jgi:adenosine kinase
VNVLETDGPQEWTWGRDSSVARLRDAYGPDAADEIAASLPAPS